MIFRSSEGNRLQENTGTADPAKAYWLLSQRVQQELLARLKVLQEIAYETAQQSGWEAGSADHGNVPDGHDRGHASGGEVVRSDAGRRAEKKSQTARGGKR